MPPKEFKPRLRTGPIEDIGSLFEVVADERQSERSVVAPSASPSAQSGGATEEMPAPAEETSKTDQATDNVVSAPTRAAATQDDRARPRRPRRSAEAPAAPAEPSAESRELIAAMTGYQPIFTYIGASAEGQLHRLAYERGGEAAKSEIVREALDALIERWEASSEADRAGLISEIRILDADDPSRTSRIYRVRHDQKRYLHLLAGRERVPMAAAVRYAISERLRELTERAG